MADCGLRIADCGLQIEIPSPDHRWAKRKIFDGAEEWWVDLAGGAAGWFIPW